jgi:hypothetical protein
MRLNINSSDLLSDKAKDFNSIRLLLDRGAHVNYVNENGWSLLLKV